MSDLLSTPERSTSGDRQPPVLDPAPTFPGRDFKEFINHTRVQTLPSKFVHTSVHVADQASNFGFRLASIEHRTELMFISDERARLRLADHPSDDLTEFLCAQRRAERRIAGDAARQAVTIVAFFQRTRPRLPPRSARSNMPRPYFTAYGANALLCSSTCSGRPTGGNARWGQAGRSQILQPAPIGVAASLFVKSSPSE